MMCFMHYGVYLRVFVCCFFFGGETGADMKSKLW